MPHIASLHVNGAARPCDADADRSLLSVLRDDLGLTGTKFGCGEGQCGACTVHIDGVPVRACLTPCGLVGPQKITTIEGLERDGAPFDPLRAPSKVEGLHPLQQALLDVGAFQCAYCASGMVMSGAALLAKNADPSDADIVRFMDGNVCRCGGYNRIIAALKLAATQLKGGGK